ncbi:MAG: hypothetical protein H0X62_03910 [Bacteroidetes bacterium]|nr:hypothetical protein [Bacteroidota bacterium]
MKFKKSLLLLPMLGLLFACSEETEQTTETNDVLQEQIITIEQSTQDLEESILSSEEEIEAAQNEIDALLNEI